MSTYPKLSMLFGVGMAALFFVSSAHASLDRIEYGPPAVTVDVGTDGSTAWGQSINGQVRDDQGNAEANVGIVYNGVEYKTDAQGRFSIPANFGGGSILVKKAGFRKISIQPKQGMIDVQLEPSVINSLYMQSGLLKQRSDRFKNAMDLIARTEINALTIDFKDDDGRVSSGLKPCIDELHAKGVYTIARIVTFKDNIGPRKHPELGLQKVGGGLWEDKNHVTYLNEYDTRAWDYVIDIAKQAVEAGFDEIQFDYVRFPTDGNRSTIKWATTDFTSQTRSSAIAGFLKKARKELGAMGAFVAADVFGITAFDTNDSGIGQRIEDVAPHLDYVCPMVYPSGYSKGTGGVKDPVGQPGAIVETSVRRYRVRADKVNSDLVIRPWLQSFRDYSGSGRNYGGPEIRSQIDGSDRAGGSGFLLWNAASKYSDQGLKPKKKVLP